MPAAETEGRRAVARMEGVTAASKVVATAERAATMDLAQWAEAPVGLAVWAEARVGKGSRAVEEAMWVEWVDEVARVV